MSFLRVHVNILRDRFFRIFCHFRTLRERCSALLKKLYNCVAKTAFYVSIGTFWGELFSGSFKTFCWMFFYGLVKTAFLVSRATLEDFFSGRKLRFFISFGERVKHFRLSGSNFLAGLSKIHRTCPWKNFDGDFLREIFHFVNIRAH